METTRDVIITISCTISIVGWSIVIYDLISKVKNKNKKLDKDVD